MYMSDFSTQLCMHIQMNIAQESMSTAVPRTLGRGRAAVLG